MPLPNPDWAISGSHCHIKCLSLKLNVWNCKHRYAVANSYFTVTITFLQFKQWQMCTTPPTCFWFCSCKSDRCQSLKSLLSKRCKYVSLQKQEAVLLLPNWSISHLLKIVTAFYSHTFHSCSDHQWWSAQSHGSDYWPACCHVSVIVGYAIASSTSPSSSGVGNTCSQQGDISRLWNRRKAKQAGNWSLGVPLSHTHTHELE